HSLSMSYSPSRQLLCCVSAPPVSLGAASVRPPPPLSSSPHATRRKHTSTTRRSMAASYQRWRRAWLLDAGGARGGPGRAVSIYSVPMMSRLVVIVTGLLCACAQPQPQPAYYPAPQQQPYDPYAANGTYQGDPNAGY